MVLMMELLMGLLKVLMVIMMALKLICSNGDYG